MASRELFSIDTQKLFLEIMLSDGDAFARVQNIFDPENFHKAMRPVASYLSKYSTKYNSVPLPSQVKGETGVALELVPESDPVLTEWFMDEFEKFTRHQALVRAIATGADMIEKGDYGPVEKLIKDAVQISLTRDMGTDYFENPRQRLLRLKSSNGQISTGWKALDSMLYGGFNRGELEIFCGGSGSGKSVFMQNICVNWMSTGMNGVYITLELSEDLCTMRIDSMVTGVASKDILRSLDDVELKVKVLGKSAGMFKVKYLPAQSTVNDIKAYLRELYIQTGKRLDFVCVDYLDLMMPVSAKVSPSDLFVKDKYVSEELRNMAKEFNVVCVTASQLNRSSVEESDFNHSHISGGVSKINTADNVFGIFISKSMREAGRYQLQAMKTRNSGGIGSKIDLSFDTNSLRIMDVDDNEAYTNLTNSAPASIIQSLKNKTTVNYPSGSQAAGSPSVAKTEVNSSKLQSMLANIKR